MCLNCGHRFTTYERYYEEGVAYDPINEDLEAIVDEPLRRMLFRMRQRYVVSADAYETILQAARGTVIKMRRAA